MALINCENLSLGYEGREIVSGLNFSVEAGDYLCIVGENGSGKSTLTRTILGLQPPMGGTVRFAGGLRQQDIGYLPQQTQVQQDFPASVWEIVRSGGVGRLGRRPFYSRTEAERVRLIMEKLELTPLARRHYRELSGGQQQRVLLARALVAAERLLLLDEPAAGLDPGVTAELYRLIARLNRDDKMTIVMVSHDLSAAVQYANHILHIGQQLFYGKTADYLQSPIGMRFLQSGGLPP